MQALLSDDSINLVAAYTQPDRRSGRGRKLQPSPVKELATIQDIPVFQPAGLRDEEAVSTMASLEPDVLVVVAYGLILPQPVLDIPRFGCINVHASLLPRWRGAAPVQRAIEMGDRESGVSLMLMDAGLDTGDVLSQSACSILPTDTSGSLFERLTQLGARELVNTLSNLSTLTQKAQKQDDSLATYAHKIDKSEAQIDWQNDAETLARRIRAFNPAPVCYTWLGEERIKIWEARVGEGSGTAGQVIHSNSRELTIATGLGGALAIEKAQFPGGKAQPIASLMNARKDSLGEGAQFGVVPGDTP